ncbi:MAG TPA: carboxymuconolactone decarboxylase family protein [Cellulomonas sp.]
MTYQESERYQRGRAVLAALGNDPDGIASWRDVDPDVGPELDRMLGEWCFGDVWGGEGLDPRSRRVVTLTAVAMHGRVPMIRAHVAGALEQGFTRREVLEVFRHLIAYAGFPVGLFASQTAAEVFAEIDAEFAADGGDGGPA